MPVIGPETYLEATEAVRDVLLLYAEMAEGYGGFGHAADWGVRFDPLRYIDARAADDGSHYVDLELLRAGSAVAVLCQYFDLWEEGRAMRSHGRHGEHLAALDAGRFAGCPDVEALLREAFRRDAWGPEDGWFADALGAVYERRVRGFFRRLADRA